MLYMQSFILSEVTTFPRGMFKVTRFGPVWLWFVAMYPMKHPMGIVLGTVSHTIDAFK